MLLEEKIEMINQRFEELKIEHLKKYIIWGAGEHTEKLLCYTELSSLPIMAIVDKRNIGKRFFSYQLLSAQEIDWGEIDAVIISSFKYQKEIKNTLIQVHNFEGEIILLYTDEEKNPFYKLQSQENTIIWKGNYQSWEAASLACIENGFSEEYTSSDILNYSIRVKENKQSYENYYHLIAWLLKIAVESGYCLTVLDLGGALGNIYYFIKDFFGELLSFKWIVVEQYHYALYGKQHLEDDTLKFYPSIEDAYKDWGNDINVALCSGVFSYIQDWQNYLGKLINLHIPNIIIDRQLTSERERIVMQHLTEKYFYQASYPCRILQKDEVMKYFEEDFILEDMKLCHQGQKIFFNDQVAEFYCFVFRRKDDVQ